MPDGPKGLYEFCSKAPLCRMLIRESYPLKHLNTFGMDVSARYYAEITSQNDLSGIFNEPVFTARPHLILGGGSNLLFRDDYEGIVMHIRLRGKKIVAENSKNVYLEAAAGEPWDELVAFCVENGWGGLENLSLIPGQAGSSPIQNIGAYGVELKDHFHCLEAWCKETGEVRTFSREDCRFAYRSSFFKEKGKDRYIILSVTFCLDKHPLIRRDYGGLQKELENMGCTNPDIADVRAAVCRIRERKLPDPKITGNAGSFFKNPVVPERTYQQLKKTHPGIVAFPENNGMKLAAGWLIDQAGWKGYRDGDAGVHPKQALVLINHGKASGIDILNLAGRIQDSVKEHFGIILEPEVNIV